MQHQQINDPSQFIRRNSTGLSKLLYPTPVADASLLQSNKNSAKQVMEQQLKESLQRLTQLEDQNRRLQQELLAMRETAQKLMTEKHILTEKLQQKIVNINQLQQYLQQENEIKNSKMSQKNQQYDNELNQKKNELKYLRQLYKEQLQEKDNMIYQLQEQLEREKCKAEDLLKSDFAVSQKLKQLENENSHLEKELIESQFSLLELQKSMTYEKNVLNYEDKISSSIGQRVPTHETETDTSYAIQNMEDKIQKLKQKSKKEKERHIASMQQLIEFYQNKLSSIKMQLVEEEKSFPTRLKNKMMSISENADNDIFIPSMPLKDQIIQAERHSLLSGLRKTQYLQSRSQFSQRYFSDEPFCFKHNIQDIVQEQQSKYQESGNKIILVESPQQSVRSSKGQYSMSKIFYIIAGGTLALYITKRIFQS